ncbi:MAG: endonuclease/exonuclease/phosphatase family protein, partial [Methylococcales bacterium]|nr:endonuclease/exonuclease/phosphatase family protein [Methylococcales bacterium]
NLFSYLGEYYFRFGLLSHFRLQYLVLFLASSSFFIIFFNKKWLLLSLLGLLFNAIPVLSIYLPTETDSTEKNNEVSLLLTNVLSSNQSYAALLNKIEQKQADIIVVLELTPQWAYELRAIDKTYPYQKLIPQRSNFGVGLYSKYPLEDITVIDFASNGIPSISANIRFNRKQLNIIATHPIPPLNKSFAEQQKRHLENLAHFTQSRKSITRSTDTTLVLVAADLNSTQWSPLYRKFMNSSGLKNTRQGKGIYPSWPVGEGIFGYLLQIPLDHVLVSKNIHTQKFEKLESISSDHFPIYIELQF